MYIIKFRINIIKIILHIQNFINIVIIVKLLTTLQNSFSNIKNSLLSLDLKSLINSLSGRFTSIV